jgi:putative ABC transport system permease protein
MRFILNMAWREARASWFRLLLFFLCIAIGVGSMVSLRSFTQIMRRSVLSESRTLVAADVRVENTQPWKPEARAILERYSASPLVRAHTEIIETQTLVRAANDPESRPVMVLLRGIKPNFPLYGEVRLLAADPEAGDGGQGTGRYSFEMVKERGALVSASLLSRLNLRVGDEIRIGRSTFTIRGVAQRVPGNWLNFSPAPRVTIAYDDIQPAGLIEFGARATHGWLFSTPEGQDDALVKALGREFRTTRLSALSSFRFVDSWLSRSLANVEGFLGLVGLAILILGGIGIASVTRVFVQQKLKTIAILKCLGGRNRRVLGAYLVQVAGLTLVGGLLGWALAWAILRIGAGHVAPYLPVDFTPATTWSAALQGLGVGLLVTLLFALPPLLEIRQVKPILVLRQVATAPTTRVRRSRPTTRITPPWRIRIRRRVKRVLRRVDWPRAASVVLLLAGLMALATWQAGDYRGATVFLVALASTALTLHFAGALLMRVLAKLRDLPWFVLRQGVGSLHRPGNQTRVILFSVGLGSLFMIAIRSQQMNVEAAYGLDLDSLTADMFLIDVQNDQRAAAQAALTRLGATEVDLAPVVRLRTTGLRWHPGSVNRTRPDDLRRRMGSEYRASYRLRLTDGERIVKGKFWDPEPSKEAEVSIGEDTARWLMLEVGDTLFFDLLGKRIEAKVTSIRALTAARARGWMTRFDILFRPGVLEAAPHMFVGMFKGPPPGKDRARLQNAFVEEFPNVMLIDALDEILEFRKRVSDLRFALSSVGGFVFACGVLILMGSIAMTKFSRLYEAAILKTLGARRKVIVLIAVTEYGVLGLVAGVIGSLGSIGVTWGLSSYGRTNVPWHLQPAVNIIGVVGTVALVIAVGVLASWDVIAKKPLGTLREG